MHADLTGTRGEYEILDVKSKSKERVPGTEWVIEFDGTGAIYVFPDYNGCTVSGPQLFCQRKDVRITRHVLPFYSAEYWDCGDTGPAPF